MADSQDSKAPKDGKADDNQNDNQESENVKALQRKLTERDNALRDALAKVDELTKKPPTNAGDEKIAALTEQIKALTGSMTALTQEREREALTKQYPDILPEFLMGKSSEERESFVTRQRALVQHQIDTLPSSHKPVFSSRQDVEAEIERVKKDPLLSTDKKMARVRELTDHASDEF